MMWRPALSLHKFRAARRGFALVSVLWGIALLSLIAAAVLSASVTARRSTHIALQQAQADALADGAINATILSLLDPQVRNHPRIDGIPYVLTFAGTPIKVSIQDEYGKIDLNAADGATLIRLFTSVGLSADDATAIADKIQDWRENAVGKRLKGAIAADYQTAGYAYGPRGKPFQSVDELKLVMGITPELFRKVEPALTIYSHQATVELATAPREVLLSQSLLNGESVDQFIANRSGNAAATSDMGVPKNPAPVFDMVDRPCSIRVEVPLPAGGVYRREVVARFTDDPKQPFWIQRWRQIRAN